MEKSYVPKLPKVQAGQFLKEVLAELGKVTWPTKAETIKLTAVVIAISLIVSAFIGGLDYLFLSITTFLFRK